MKAGSRQDVGRKKRIKQMGKSIRILFGVGMLYAFVAARTPFRIPCMVRLVTGFYCPGCGMTRMCLSILRLDFATAFRCNQLVFLSLPVLSGIVVYTLYRYIRYGSMVYTGKIGKVIQALLVVLVVLSLGFGIVRNLPGMECLQPPEGI